MRNRSRGVLRTGIILSSWIRLNLIIFAVFFTVYLINRFLSPMNGVPYIGYLCQNHLNDYIGGIIFCIYVNAVLIFAKRKPLTRLIHLFALMIPVSVLWEYFFPLMLSYSTSDPLDVVAYLLGTVTYYLLIRGTEYQKRI